MNIKQEIQERIIYHKDHIRNCKEHHDSVQEHYEIETRKGLDEFQLKALYVWRKEEQSRMIALRVFHLQEKKWLEGVLENV